MSMIGNLPFSSQIVENKAKMMSNQNMSSKMSEASKSKMSVAADGEKALYNVPTLGVLNPELAQLPAQMVNDPNFESLKRIKE